MRKGRVSSGPHPPCWPKPRPLNSGPLKDAQRCPATPNSFGSGERARLMPATSPPSTAMPSCSSFSPVAISPTHSALSSFLSTSGTTRSASPIAYSSAAVPCVAKAIWPASRSAPKPFSSSHAATLTPLVIVSCPWSDPTMSRMSSPSARNASMVAATSPTSASICLSAAMCAGEPIGALCMVRSGSPNHMTEIARGLPFSTSSQKRPAMAISPSRPPLIGSGGTSDPPGPYEPARWRTSPCSSGSRKYAAPGETFE